MEHRDAARFKRAIGITGSADADRRGGVFADWSKLSATVKASLGELKLEREQTLILKPGLAHRYWLWASGDTRVSVSVYVSSVGVALAREQLVEIASQTTMSTIPYTTGPNGLGEVSVQDQTPPSILIWVWHNVCVDARAQSDGSLFALLPLAFAVERFMERHVVDDVSIRLPQVTGVTLSSQRLRVGETLEVGVQLPVGEYSESFMFSANEVGDLHLRPRAHGPVSATFIVTQAGSTALEISVAHRDTLLTHTSRANLELLPAEGTP